MRDGSEGQERIRRWLMLLLRLGCFAGASCATMAHGRSQEIIVMSDPVAAKVYIGNKLVGTTPVRFVLSRVRFR